MKRSANQHYEVVVAGAGPAGLHAARAAAQAGARVLVLDDNPLPGGQVWRQGPHHPPQRGLLAIQTALEAHPGVTVWSGARVVAPLPEGGLLVEAAEQGGI